MITTILTTKITMPQAKPDLIMRTGLVQALHAHTTPITLISASAGYGKTSLLQQYLATVPDAIAWLAFDEDDNDLTRFWSYLTAALHQASPISEALRHLTPTTPAEVQDALTILLNDLAAGPATMLVFDDWHLIEHPALEHILQLLVQHLPATIRIIISSRIDPDLPLARLRTQGRLCEIREHDLRLSLDETQHYLQALALTPTDLQAIHAKTEGWAAGIQLAALALAQEPDPQSFIQAFTGTHRYLMDYLLDEVWAQQSPAIQAFLIQTSLLRRLHAAVCNAVCNTTDSQHILEDLYQRHVFVMPLDHHRQWYRYHQLFTDLLQQRLRQDSRYDLATLHERASRWYAADAAANADRAAWHEALHHALEARNAAWTIELLAQQADALWQAGQLEPLKRALASLPASALAQEPGLLVFQAWQQMLNGHYEQAQASLQHAEIHQHTPTIDGRIAVCYAFLATFQHQPAAAIEHAQTALDQLASSDPWYSSAAVALGDAQAIIGQPAQAESAYRKALQHASTGQNWYFSLNAAFKLAGVQRQQGQLRTAYTTCTTYIAQAEQLQLGQSAFAGVLYAVKGDIEVEWHQCELASHSMQAALQAHQQRTHLGLYGWVHLYYTRFLIATGAYQTAEQTIQRMLNEVPLPAWLKHPFQLTQVQLWLAQGQLQAAQDWLQHISLAEPLQPAGDGLYLTASLVFLQTQQTHDVARLVRHVLAAATAAQRWQTVALAQLIQALYVYQTQHIDAALPILQQALQRTEPENVIQSIVGLGPQLRPLLELAQRHNPASNYLRTLGVAFGMPEDSPKLPEALSEREREVLRLIVAGLTNQHIADQLMISLNTVLYHTKNIYGKLGVQRRTQAIQKAQQLHLLD